MREPHSARRCFLAGRDKIHAVEHDGAAADAAAGPGKAHGGKTEGRFAGTGFADEAQHLAALQGQIDALDDRVPDVVAVALDLEALDVEKDFALGARLWLVSCVHRAAHSSCAGTSRLRN